MRITEVRNHRVTITPDPNSYHISHKTPEQIAAFTMGLTQELLRKVKRHIEEYDTAQIEYDRVALCSFCAYEYAADEPASALPYCCSKAQEEFLRDDPLFVGNTREDREEIAEIRKDLNIV